MKLLIFEYICGGGFLGQPLPAALAQEGRLMLQALLNDLTELGDIKICLPLDPRMSDVAVPDSCQVFYWSENMDNMKTVFSAWLERVDAVWFIAPESGLLLFKLVQQAERLGKWILNCSSSAIQICSDKLQTLRCLQQAGIKTPISMPFTMESHNLAFPVVIKPLDGVGCYATYRVQTQADYLHLQPLLPSFDQMMVQEWVVGEALSLSVLCLPDRAQLLCVNRQHLNINNGKFELQACEVNIQGMNRELYQTLANQIFQAIDGLYGYIGIDLIQPPDESPVILEINPRLTTSYAGLRKALGVNIAARLFDPVQESQLGSETVMITL